MATISAAPDILRVVDGEYFARGDLVAGSAINRGDVLVLNTSGQAITRPITGTPLPIIGVALDAAAQYDTVTYVGLNGAVVTVYNDSTTSAIVVGSWVKASAAFAGAVVATTTATDTTIVGTALEAIPAPGSGRIILRIR